MIYCRTIVFYYDAVDCQLRLRWEARCYHAGKYNYLGSFELEEEAVACRERYAAAQQKRQEQEEQQGEQQEQRRREQQLGRGQGHGQQEQGRSPQPLRQQPSNSRRGLRSSALPEAALRILGGSGSGSGSSFDPFGGTLSSPSSHASRGGSAASPYSSSSSSARAAAAALVRAVDGRGTVVVHDPVARGAGARLHLVPGMKAVIPRGARHSVSFGPGCLHVFAVDVHNRRFLPASAAAALAEAATSSSSSAASALALAPSSAAVPEPMAREAGSSGCGGGSPWSGAFVEDDDGGALAASLW